MLCIDDEQVRGLLPELSRQLITYGTREEADIRARDIRPEGLSTRFVVETPGHGAFPVRLNMPGRHNVLNALAAIAIALELDVPVAAIQRGLQEFQGIDRRFQANDCQLPDGRLITLVDDYGHHPREVAATLDAVREGWPGRRLVLVFQPHRYTRTQELFEDFAQVLSRPDRLLLCEVYAAGEQPIPGADGRALARAIRARGEVEPLFVDPLDQLPALLERVIEDGDMVLTLGAGDIGVTAAGLAGRLSVREGTDET